MVGSNFLWIGIGYLLGSIPFGLLLTRMIGVDIRKVGSGNIGTTNVLRTGNKGLAAATLLLDAGKGAAAVLLGQHFGGVEAGMLAGVAAFIGHCFPVWLGFKGGKGVATLLGVALAAVPLAGVAALLAWAAGRGRDAVFVGRRHGCGGCGAGGGVGSGLSALGHRAGGDGGHPDRQAPREHRPPAQGHRKQDRSQIMTGCRASRPARRRLF